MILMGDKQWDAFVSAVLPPACHYTKNQGMVTTYNKHYIQIKRMGLKIRIKNNFIQNKATKIDLCTKYILKREWNLKVAVQ